MDKTPNLLHLIIGFFSVFIFLYRAIVLMIPMINDGIQKNMGNVFIPEYGQTVEIPVQYG